MLRRPRGSFRTMSAISLRCSAKPLRTISRGFARQLLQVLARHSLVPEHPRISASHSIDVALTFIEIAIAELDPHYMRGYGRVSEEGATDLYGVIAELQSAAKELHRYILELQSGEARERVEEH